MDLSLYLQGDLSRNEGKGIRKMSEHPVVHNNVFGRRWDHGRLFFPASRTINQSKPTKLFQCGNFLHIYILYLFVTGSVRHCTCCNALRYSKSRKNMYEITSLFTRQRCIAFPQLNMKLRQYQIQLHEVFSLDMFIITVPPKASYDCCHSNQYCCFLFSLTVQSTENVNKRKNL